MLGNPPALLVLDVQKGFDDPYWGKRNNLQAEDNILKLLTEWRTRQWTVIYSQHLSLQPKSPLYHKDKVGTQFKDMIQPQEGEKIFPKNVNSAFIGTHLETYLIDQQLKSVVITGLSTQHCVSTTTRMSSNLGFETYLVEDAIAAFDATDHNGIHYSADQVQKVELALLNKEFATIVKTNQVLNQIAHE
ncbi:cysteine hydrolase family protein [Cytobacillus sp. FJAT-54145]|uniref:Cysteine hydrolase family protein n=1 Tax=Cytobacillus spartinae TaxID=3299023 RepID=A0ABW6KI07_9BACI